MFMIHVLYCDIPEVGNTNKGIEKIQFLYCILVQSN